MSRIERRKNLRIPYQLGVSTNLTTTGLLETHDISSYGIYVKTSNPLNLDSKVFVSFNIPDSPMPIKTYGRVAWNNYEDSNQQSKGMGIEFLSLTEFDNKRLEKFLDLIHREKIDHDINIDSDNTTLFNFSQISKDNLHDRSKKIVAWEKDMKQKGYYTYRRQLVSPCANRVLIMDEGKEREMIMLGSNSYLGLSSHPKVIEAVKEATEKYGVGAASAPNLAGTFDLHRKLEIEVAKLKGTEDAIIFPFRLCNKCRHYFLFFKKKMILP